MNIKFEEIFIGDKIYIFIVVMSGYVIVIDNRVIIVIVRVVGVFEDKGVGIEFYVKVGEKVKEGDLFFMIYVEYEVRFD